MVEWNRVEWVVLGVLDMCWYKGLGFQIIIWVEMTISYSWFQNEIGVCILVLVGHFHATVSEWVSIICMFNHMIIIEDKNNPISGQNSQECTIWYSYKIVLFQPFNDRICRDSTRINCGSIFIYQYEKSGTTYMTLR